MPSPFPGMDPYIESQFGEFHKRFIIYATDALRKVLPAGLKAVVEERLIVSGTEEYRAIYPDMSVLEDGPAPKRASRSTGGLAVAKPITIELSRESRTEVFIEIRAADTPSMVVTVFELLSPSNKKRGDASHEEYVQKQNECLKGGINLVEIDLLRRGEWTVAVPQEFISPARRTHYRTVVRRGSRPDRVEYYPIPLKYPLPVIGVPLRPTDADAPLDLQAVMNQCYDNGPYQDNDYTVDPRPPLSDADRKWIDQLLRKKGLRKAKKRK